MEGEGVCTNAVGVRRMARTVYIAWIAQVELSANA